MFKHLNILKKFQIYIYVYYWVKQKTFNHKQKLSFEMVPKKSKKNKTVENATKNDQKFKLALDLVLKESIN